MEFAVILLIVASIAVGVTSAIVTTWSLRARFFSLQDAVQRMEGALLREVKSRAGQERWKRPSQADEALAAKLELAKNPPAPTKQWWQTDLPRSFSG